MADNKSFDPRDNEGYWNPAKQNSKESKKAGVNLKDAEKNATSISKKMLGEKGDDKAGFKYSPQLSPSSKAKAARQLAKVFGGKKKYGWIGGALVGIFITILFIAAPLFGPLQMFENLEDFHLGPRRNTISARTVRVIKKIRAKPNATDPVTKRLAKVDIDDLQTEFTAKGYSLELDTNGTPTGITDLDGNFRSLDNIDEAVELLDDAVPTSKAASRGYMRKLFKSSTGYSWSSILGRADPDKSIWDWIRTRARLKDVDVDLTSDTSATNDTDPNNPDLAELADEVDTGSGITDEAVEASKAKKLAGASDAEAVRAGTGVLKEKVTGKSAIITTLILACTSKAVYDNQLQMRWMNFKGAISSFFDLAIIADEIKTGNVRSAKHIGEFMEQYSNESGSFASSAAWQEITGEEVTGPGLLPENDINSSLTSDDFMGSLLGGIAGVGGAVNNIPVLSQLCSAINNAIGTAVGGFIANLVDGAFATAEIVGACTVGAAVSFGGTCALKLGSTAAFEIGLPRLFSVILSAFVEKTLEDPAQAFNYLSQAGALVNSESSRTGRPVDNETYVANDLNPYLEKKAQKNQSLYARYLSPENSNSLLYQMGVWKTNLVNSGMNVSDSIVYLAKAPFRLLGSMFERLSGMGSVLAASNDEVDPHDSIQKYSYRTDSLNSDPVELANEVTLMLGSDPELQKTAEYCMGYDYSNDRLDLSLQLPLYSDPGSDEGGFFAQLANFLNGPQTAEKNNKLVQDYCIPNSSGELNSGVSLDDYEKLGRFVDDLIITESVITYVSPGKVYSGNQGGSSSTGSTGSSSGNGNTPVRCVTDPNGNIISNPGDPPCIL